MQNQILFAIQKIRKSKIRAYVKAITKTINKTSGASFDKGYIAVNTSQLLNKKIITNVKNSQPLDSFRIDDTELCQQNTQFIRSLLDDIINNVLGNLEKLSDETKITTYHTNEMSTIVQQFTSDDTLIPIPNDIYTPITENYRTSISISSIDESQKVELKICELNKSVNSELALLNYKMDSLSEYLNKLVSSSLRSQQEKSLKESNIASKKTYVQKMK